MGSRPRSANSPAPASILQCLRGAEACCRAEGWGEQNLASPSRTRPTPPAQARPPWGVLQPHLSGPLYQLPGLCTLHAQARSAYSRGHLLPEAFPDYSAKPGKEGIPELCSCCFCGPSPGDVGPSQAVILLWGGGVGLPHPFFNFAGVEGAGGGGRALPVVTN